MARRTPSRSYPLELILRPHGTAELVNSDEKVLWASDADEDFKEEFPDEFLNEDEFDDVLDWLYHNGVVSEKEFDQFENDSWDMTVESLDGEDLEEETEDEEDEFRSKD